MKITKKIPNNALFMYYAKVVPTLYTTSSKVDENSLVSNQFSVTEHQKVIPSNNPAISGVRIPEGHEAEAINNSSVSFFYELSPIMVQTTTKWRPFLSFLTQLCAILGGVFTVASIVDKFIYGTVQHVQKKILLGKMN